MNRRVWRNLDFVLLGGVLSLIGIGIAMIHSATLDPTTQPRFWDDYVFRQAVYAVVGLAAMFAVALLDYRLLQGSAQIIYGFGLLLLLLVLVVGRVFGGARGWFDLRAFPLQPAELAKPLLILALARYFVEWRDDIGHPIHLAVSFLYTAVPAALVYMQPDMGTAVMLVAIWIGMAWAAGVPAWQFALLGGTGLLAAPRVWSALQPYMRERILAFLNRGVDPLSQGYNVRQALISVGSGGLWGKGFARGTQSQLHFLRVRHTDFIFSVYAEELGFVACIVLFILFVIVLLRITRCAALARDPFGQLIACGVAVMIFSQAFVNLAVNMGLLPTTGLPLPFISAGGSSLVTMLIGIGLVQSVLVRHRKLDFE